MTPHAKLLNRIIFVQAIVGIAIAIYVLQSFLRDASIYCVSSGCETVRKASASYLFGVPVPAFGLVGYFCIALFSFLLTTAKKHIYATILLSIALFGVAFVSWFTYTEVFVIKALCMWCTISAVNMVILAILALQLKNSLSHSQTHS